MEKRPRLKIGLTVADRFLETAGWAVVVILWSLTLGSYADLPEIIPTHFDVSGKPDGYGSKSSILALPVLGTVIYIGMTILNRYPHVFNYLVTITSENALRQYTVATRMLRVLKLAVVAAFTGIIFLTREASLSTADVQVPWLMPLAMGIIFVPLLYFIYRSIRER